MKRQLLTLVYMVLVLVQSSERVGALETSNDKVALEQAFEAWLTAFNKHDAKALAKEYAEDANIMTPSGETFKGREAVEKNFAELFAKNANVKTKLSQVTRTFLAQDIVVEDGSWEESGHSEAGLPTKGYYSTILVKRNGKWVSIHERAWVPVKGP